ncbi:hypothetical protein PHLCEN_2v13181 [Hermanssonia centrifuga]|uniref:Major facilitator superfamily (MFS) profile domain-containing protein n=1 Tax=Hermanssonia centrifuga TaxID=98765 RepID=A0A2R6NFA3_9APHY|nr:hypothetical protein PHLCEN_2v13181 [Hermanssonia centrifuga]
MAPRFLTNLIPRKEQRRGDRPLLEVLRSLNWVQWGHFWSGWLAWTCDAVDFFSVSLSVTNLSKQFNRDTHDITTAITLTLLLRSAGAVIFGILSDRYGRKWPLVINLLMISALELGSGFVQTYSQFLGVRAIFGIAMGGIWGMAASTSLENLPVEVRGLASGVLQQGYAVGYLIAAIINLFLVPEVSASWRALFWTAAGLSAFSACVRATLPESAIFLRAKAHERASGHTTTHKTKIFLRETKEMLKKHWLLCIYAVLLMTGIKPLSTIGFNFLSHGSQDLYPTYLTKSKGFSDHDATVATIIGNCIPIQLAEMSPPAFRATFPGVAYQLGNMVSSASAQIEATGGDNLQTTLPGQTTPVPDYATVQGILIGVVSAFVLFITIIGPEKHGAHFEKHKTAFEEGGGRDDVVDDDEPQPDTAAVRDAESSRPTSIREEDEKKSSSSEKNV